MSETKDKTRVLIIMPSMRGGGAERVLINILNLIDHSSFEIHLFIGVKGGVLDGQIPKHLPVHYIYPNKYIASIAFRLWHKFGSLFLFKYFGKKITGDYHTAISFLDSFYTEFLFYNRASINKRITVLHSSYKTYKNKFKYIRGKNYTKLQKRYENIDLIVGVSNDVLSEFKEIFGQINSDSKVIYNPMNSAEVVSKSQVKIEAFTTKGINLIAVGSHLHVKGYKKLINACSIIKKKGLEFTLRIVGDGPLFAEHEALIKSNELESNIKLIGFVSNPYSYMSVSDVFVMSSDAEGLPTALCEAMILGLPTLVTNVAGCREVVDNGAYGLCVTNSVDALAQGLEQLISDQELRSRYIQKSKERALIFEDNQRIKDYVSLFLLGNQ